MGALHRGHAALIERARAECDVVIVTIFVNPLQFDRADDLERYPRTLDADMALCEQARRRSGVRPDAELRCIPSEPRCTVEVSLLGDHLCGRFRPGHFRGVATVVMKLLQIVAGRRRLLR